MPKLVLTMYHVQEQLISNGKIEQSRNSVATNNLGWKMHKITSSRINTDFIRKQNKNVPPRDA